MDMIIDTQVVSYQFKNLYIETGAHNIVVTSITANEFLLAQPSKNNSPKYYVLHPKKYKSLVNASLSKDKTQISNEYFKNPRWAKQGSRRTDQIVIDFNNQFLPYRKFGSNAISEVINSKLPYFYGYCIAHLSKKDQKLLQKRFKFILDQNYYCLPINHSIIEIGLELFAQFTKKYNPKFDIRNTINDILILATAVEEKKHLLTKDNLLSKFSAEYFGAKFQNTGNNLLIDFSTGSKTKKSSNAESKGYINQGWHYSIRNRTMY